jgi:hypothetical protein
LLIFNRNFLLCLIFFFLEIMGWSKSVLNWYFHMKLLWHIFLSKSAFWKLYWTRRSGWSEEELVTEQRSYVVDGRSRGWTAQNWVWKYVLVHWKWTSLFLLQFFTSVWNIMQETQDNLPVLVLEKCPWERLSMAFQHCLPSLVIVVPGVKRGSANSGDS